MSHLPKAEVTVTLPRMLPMFEGPLAYLMEMVLLQDGNGISYDSDSDEIVYHRVVTAQDRESFALLQEATEVWILQRGGVPQ